MAENDQPLTALQLDILQLESRTWAQDGAKISEFRRRHPMVTETAYYLALLRLLSDRRAYEYANQRYAPMLRRMAENQQSALVKRVGLRPGVPAP